jgi:NitT/TauT family transport system substrate-binding protein
MGENVAGLTAGQIDVAQMFEPFVEEALRRGAHVWLPASARGRTSYTVFATSRQRLADDPEPFRRMVRAIYKTQQWLTANPPEALAQLIGDHYFPGLDRGVLTASLTRYKVQGVWGNDPILPQEGFDRLRRALLASGFLAHPVSFTDCVDNSLAQEAISAS